MEKFDNCGTTLLTELASLNLALERNQLEADAARADQDAYVAMQQHLETNIEVCVCCSLQLLELDYLTDSPR